MAPEPDNHAVLARAGRQRILEGEDVLTVLMWAMGEAVKRARRQGPFRGSEKTAEVDLWGGREPVPTRPEPPSEPQEDTNPRYSRRPTQPAPPWPPALPPGRKR